MPLLPWMHNYLESNVGHAHHLANQHYRPFSGHVPEHVSRRYMPMNQLEQQASLLAQNTGAANPYVREAERMAQAGAQRFPEHHQAYMNPYQEQVLDRIAQLGNRNLTENILPALEARFTRLGQHGGSRHAQLSERAARDIQSEISGRQAEAAHQGYGQAMQGFNWDQARKMQEADLQARLGQNMTANRLADVEGLQKQGLINRELHERPFRAAEAEHHAEQMDPMTRRAFMSNILHGMPFSNLQNNPQSPHRRGWQQGAAGFAAQHGPGIGRAFMRGVGDLFSAFGAGNRPMGNSNAAAQGLFGRSVRNFVPNLG